VGLLAPGVNFKLGLELDGGAGTPYASYAARAGQAVRLSVRTQGGERPVMETHALVAGQPGDLVSVYVSTGTDTDGDGLPDEWERQLIANSDGRLHALADVHPGDDADGDGVSNWDEYRAGTYAFLPGDFLAVEEWAGVAGDRLRLRFLTTRGITYRVYGASQLGGTDDWQPQRFALSESDPVLPHEALVGDGFYVSVYVALGGSQQFYRLRAQ